MDHQHRHSTEQQEAEAAIRKALQEHLKQDADITFGANPKEWVLNWMPIVKPL